MHTDNEISPPWSAETCDAGGRDMFNDAVAHRPDQFTARHFSLLGRQFHFYTVGNRLHDFLSAAITHLQPGIDTAGPGDLSAYLWDEELSGLPCLDAPLPGRADEDEFTTISDDQLRVREMRGQWAMELDRRRGEICGRIRLGAARPLLHDLCKPLQTLISVWARDTGIPLVHAGMVARDGFGVLLAGAGGAGKSTTALACTVAGLDFLGDDRIGLEDTGNGFKGHGIYNSVLVDQAQLARFPSLARHATAPRHPTRERKPLVFLNDAYPHRLPPFARIQAVALPRVVGGARTALRPASAAAALRVMAPSSLILPLGPGPVGMRRMAALVRAVPCFWLDLGTDLEQIPASIDGVLDEVVR